MTKEQRELYDYFDHMWDDLKKNKSKKPKTTDAGKEIAKLLKDLDFSFKTSPVYAKKQTSYIRKSSSSKSQNCILKMHYVTDRNKHQAFLIQYMTQLNKKDIDEKPLLFSDVNVDKSFFDSYLKSMTDLHFRFIISPENQNVDLKVAAKSFIEKLNQLYGYDLMWVGSIHQNTEHKHAHILINGNDKNGRAVRFPKSFVKETGRMMIQNICTGLIGFRTIDDVRQKRETEPYVERFCSIDDELTKHEKKLGTSTGQFKTFVITHTENEKQRCQKLVELGLAKQNSDNNNSYMLEKDWQDKLRVLGKYNVYKKARSNMKFVSAYNLELWDDSKPEFDGFVTQLLYKDDEKNWCNACVVENVKLGKAYLIPFPGEMPDYRFFKQAVHCGKYISKKGRIYPKIQRLRENDL